MLFVESFFLSDVVWHVGKGQGRKADSYLVPAFRSLSHVRQDIQNREQRNEGEKS
jgi:hypothetical protein